MAKLKSPGKSKPVVYFSGRASSSLSRKPLVYFSGLREFRAERKGSGSGGESDLHSATGWTHRCFSFPYVAQGAARYMREAAAAMDYCLKSGVGVLLDSGGYTSFKSEGRLKGEALTQYLRHYASWISAFGPDKFDHYISFDYVQSAPDVFKTFTRLCKLGLRPVPVYHGDSPLDWLRKYLDLGCEVVGLGTMENGSTRSARLRFFDQSFALLAKVAPQVKVHGFSVTGENMFRFPWHSVDSTSWFQAAVHGQILRPDVTRAKVTSLHVSDERAGPRMVMGTRAAHLFAHLDEIRANCQAFNVPFQKLPGDKFWRAVYNVRVTLKATAEFARPSYSSWGSVL